MRETDSGNDVGLISICTRNRENLTAEVGFIILDGFKGKGYATEAISVQR
ncbi:GNAT family N-acetyltransferase [Brevibacillus porteri]